MKGIIFTSFNDMIEEKFGLETWEKLIDKVHPENHGIYTAGGTYEDTELIGYVKELSELTKTEQPQLIEAFGVYLFPVLASKYPSFLNHNNLKDFLKSIDKVIHVEVHKLCPEANLPTMSYEDPAPNELNIIYRSPRKLCPLAVGLIKGAADHFKTLTTINHRQCMHHGYDHCRLEVTIGK